MSKSPWLVVAMTCSLAATPAISHAQAADALKEHPQDFMHDVLGALFSPNWNLFLHGGFATDERFLLQQAVPSAAGERSLEGRSGYAVGAGAGVDMFLRMGVRASYTFSSRDLKFKTNNGNGSDVLDISDVGRLRSHTAALEVMRYMLPSGASINPYGTLGVQGTWWTLDQQSPLVVGDGAGTPFSISPLFSFGVQVKATEHWGGRLETTLTSGHNPFTGNRSFRSLAGPVIDEPSGINRADFRLAGVYHFGRPKAQDANSVAKRN